MKPKANDLRAEEIRGALLAIAARNDGLLAPQEIVDAARDPDSVLHDEFDWDDETAGEHYRLLQASAIVRRVKLTVMKLDQDEKRVTLTPIRAFQSRPSQRSKDGGYEDTRNILKDPAKREELLAQVLKELMAYRKRYAQLSALADVWAAVDAASGIKPARAGKSAEVRPNA